MNRTQLFQELKREMQEWIDRLDETNHQEIKGNVDAYFTAMESISALPALPGKESQDKAGLIEKDAEPEKEVIDHKIHKKREESGLEESYTKEKARKSLSEESQKSYVASARHFYEEASSVIEPIESEGNQEATSLITREPDGEVKGYVFERKLRGGVLPEIGAFVPEGIIRRLGIQHGDILSAEKLSESFGRVKYLYDLLEAKGQGEALERVQMNYCMVEKQAGSLMVRGSYLTNEKIRFNEVPFPILLSEGDIQQFGIKEGDILDIAYKAHNPSENKVLWIHDNELPVVTEPRKDAKPAEDEPKKDAPEELEQTLVGAEVLVVGNEGSRSQYQNQVEKRGGKFLWLDANSKQDSFASLVRQASFVIFLNGKNRHVPMKQLKQLCKNYNKPFEGTFNEGVSSIIRTAEELAEKYVGGCHKQSV